MKFMRLSITKPIATGLMLTVCSFTGQLFAQQAPAASQADSQSNTTLYASSEPLPDSPGVSAQASQNQSQQSQSGQTNTNAAPPAANTEQQPLGTAAAPAVNPVGVPASQPAGVAVAPAKPHKVWTLVVKVGAIAGAAVAVGSVMALSKASPSKPPGAP
jgi:K+-sensing histidine kinase KdpD